MGCGVRPPDRPGHRGTAVVLLVLGFAGWEALLLPTATMDLARGPNLTTIVALAFAVPFLASLVLFLGRRRLGAGVAALVAGGMMSAIVARGGPSIATIPPALTLASGFVLVLLFAFVDSVGGGADPRDRRARARER